MKAEFTLHTSSFTLHTFIASPAAHWGVVGTFSGRPERS
jgi:hypothetical protein